ncbi:MAG: hypothetical protein QNK04_24245 [Myxococcota bacterium]|nr:hypothetical protein [Myxococcota bacterium]
MKGLDWLGKRAIALAPVPSLDAGIPLGAYARLLIRSRLPGRAQWIALVEGPAGPLRVLRGERPVSELREQLPGRTGRFVFFRCDRLRKVHHSLAALGAEIHGAERHLVFLPVHAESPPQRRRYEHLDAFACDLESARQILEDAGQEPRDVTYQAGRWALDTDEAFRLLIRQIPVREPPARAGTEANLRVVVPHRGDLSHLRRCLSKLAQAVRGLRSQVHVALDQEVDQEELELAKAFPDMHFWQVWPARSGPYLARHVLGTTAGEEFVALQDSDDLSCEDRLARQLEVMERGEHDAVGCHMLEVGDQAKRIRPYRYPADANAPLAERPQNTQFHPSLMLRRDALLEAGGFSTVRRFASDREFNLRAHFRSLRLGNVDEFLYLRGERLDSLSKSAETGMECDTRRELHDRWHEDWERIRDGHLHVDDSSLGPSHGDPMPELIPLDRDLAGTAEARGRGGRS